MPEDETTATSGIVHENAQPLVAANDSHSDYEDDASVASSTQSLTDSIRDHIYENGRRYHRKSEHYLMPSDETEQDRLDMAHHLQLLILGGALHMAPVPPNPPNVLDVGTGTGIWALDFGELHQGSAVIGVDQMPIQTTWTWPNVKFEVDDIEKEWTWKKNKFDFIHMRHLATSIRNWPYLFQQMYDHAAPGAWVEISEHTLDELYCDDGSVPEDSIFRRYMRTLGLSVTKAGAHGYLHGRDYKRMLLEAGFVDVTIYTFKVPCGGWPKSRRFKDIGRWCAEALKTGLEAYGLALMTRYGLTEMDARELVNGSMEAMRLGKEHGYYIQYQVVGRKPRADEVAV
ncbi:S-adenosyl-L-methionine-dependent methyltransferase [Ascodesmis nigricans]|uniref:S-adenosyl-L-methionine-dependent methyltransferase n=1 Tax=Ascodesmis nigricans TaxID=341454 RepID=A0A4S2MKI5_9PEZI|nr:S-adenosyl-L-methionine-dependent methyltransferase [Ascodesmis nigricans]